MRIPGVSAVFGAILLAGALGLPAAAGAEGIALTMNQAKIIKIARPANTVVIGNPEIADAVVQDSTTIVLTGRGFGVTNIVVLDAEGLPIVDEQIVVSRQTVNSVRVYRRADVQTLSCTPFCESSYKSEAERTSEMEMSRQ
ncbi:pilus assembly protein N-terminal domain-containing protein [Chelativorans sp. SCAU2101]|mgnify:FL=1|jgi:Flp pilus assembly secretin CpaC|uniref:Pilus assembly protein N-terminal domain-containing protein n=1 Tax=Chelativorans petroleitrophicus TaxID=2975484 RepID=A0A9X2X8E3_9HYPH|nr:pilus assembly protein N-terminal domain-containing protein [Chelativorans petroleitrophicus]MCT8990014.1 pilus assembly protein N-terminal domain-containing protein [Chelativorans petroleitrophicus]